MRSPEEGISYDPHGAIGPQAHPRLPANGLAGPLTDRKGTG
jgi:hypothetical protein